MTTSKSQYKQLLGEIQSFTGQVKAQWRQASELLKKILDHHFDMEDGGGKKDCSLIGKMYNDLLDHHASIAKAIKLCVKETAGITFRADKEKEGRYIASVDAKEWSRVEGELSAIAFYKLEHEGLKAFKPVKAPSSRNSVNHSKVHGITESIDKAIAQLEQNPEASEKVKQVKAQLSGIFTEVQNLLTEYGLGNMASKMLKAYARDIDKQFKESEEKESATNEEKAA